MSTPRKKLPVKPSIEHLRKQAKRLSRVDPALELADGWLNLTRVELNVWPDNEPALRLYRRFGFEVEGTLRQYALRDGRLVDAVLMSRLRPAPLPAT